MKTIALHEKDQKKLGDKVEFLYTLDPVKSRVEPLVNSLKEFISKQGKNIQELIDSDNEEETIREYEAIRKHLGICAGRHQRDVWGFIRLLLLRSAG